MQNVLSQILHVIGHGVMIPCLIILILLIVLALLQAGSCMAEYFTQKRKYIRDAGKLILDIQSVDGITSSQVQDIVENAALLKRQKIVVKQVLESIDTGANKASVTALADRLISYEEAFYKRELYKTDIIAKLGPMFGLLGTLIPLGPGIIALGKGDTQTLAASIGVAFDTTIAGLLAASLSLVISGVRKRWYGDYMDTLDTLLECIIEELIGDVE